MAIYRRIRVMSIKILKRLFKLHLFMFYLILPIIKLKYVNFNRNNLLYSNLGKECHSFGKINQNQGRLRLQH
jgi:hypothetical protein